MNLAAMIDHTMLKPEATKSNIIKHCEEAKEHQFASVCINPYYVSLAYSLLKETRVKVCTVVGFPLGATTCEQKAEETRQALQQGAKEIDMVINIGALKAGDRMEVLRDMKAVVDAAEGNIVKVIIEACLLTDDEKVMACQLSEEAGAHFVKTSTGFSSGGATVQDVALMKKNGGRSDASKSFRRRP